MTIAQWIHFLSALALSVQCTPTSSIQMLVLRPVLCLQVLAAVFVFSSYNAISCSTHLSRSSLYLASTALAVPYTALVRASSNSNGENYCFICRKKFISYKYYNSCDICGDTYIRTCEERSKREENKISKKMELDVKRKERERRRKWEEEKRQIEEDCKRRGKKSSGRRKEPGIQLRYLHHPVRSMLPNVNAHSASHVPAQFDTYSLGKYENTESLARAEWKETVS